MSPDAAPNVHPNSAWPGAAALREQWQLDPAWTYLNHGGYGACPKVIVQAQAAWQERFERQPIQFLYREVEQELRPLQVRLGRFLGADPGDLAFIANATTGVSTVLRSLRFEPGDEILVGSHSYPAILNAADYIAKRHGGRMTVAEMPFPIAGPEEALAAVEGAISERTRLLIIDHITSPTALILPLKQIVDAAKARGVEVLVDGAHAPGMLDINLRSLGADYYTGNCHKWMCAPKGAAFLWVAPEKQEEIIPLSISLGWMIRKEGESSFQANFKYTGNADPTTIGTPEEKKKKKKKLPGGWEAIRQHNQALLLQARALLCDALGVEPFAPESMLGSLCTFPLPPGSAQALENRLVEEFRIELPLLAWPFRMKDEPGSRYFRISAQVYNDIEQYEFLAQCLARCLREE